MSNQTNFLSPDCAHIRVNLLAYFVSHKFSLNVCSYVEKKYLTTHFSRNPYV